MSTTTPPPPPPPIEGLELPADDASPLLASFITFLTLSIHALLYHRTLYPPATFLTARALNLLVHQSRHPRLCDWINDAIDAIAVQLETGTVRRIAVVMHAPETLHVLERWVFDVASFPVWGKILPRDDEDEDDGIEYEVDENGDPIEPKEGEGEGENEDDEEEEESEPEPEPEDEDEDEDDDENKLEDEGPINWTEVNEALRGALCRISHAAESKPALPKGSTFTLAVEFRGHETAPIGHRQPWIPSRPYRRRRSRLRRWRKGLSRRRHSVITSTTAIRSVRAGPIFFECWMEQAETLAPRTPSAVGAADAENAARAVRAARAAKAANDASAARLS